MRAAATPTPGPQQPPPVQTPTPTPTPTPQLPEPVAGRNVNATPVKGTVKVKLPGSKSYVDLSQAQQLPVGTTVDTRKGTVRDHGRRARRDGEVLRRHLQDQPDARASGR